MVSCDLTLTMTIMIIDDNDDNDDNNNDNTFLNKNHKIMIRVL